MKTARKKPCKSEGAPTVDCFGSIPHKRLMKAVSLRVEDKNILKMIRQWLKCGVMEAGQFKETIAGTPQGGVISPLLANIYLDALDKLWEKHKMNSRFGNNAHLVRYADDLVILTDKSPEAAERLLRETLGRLELTPHPEKTRVLNAKEGHFDFLGFNFRQRKNSKTGKWFCLIQPSRKAQKKLRESIREATSSSALAALDDVVTGRVNPIVRGWVNYFRIGNSGKVFKKIRNFVRGRISRLIRRRQKRRGFGWGRISGEFLYGKLGLFYDYGVVRSPRPATA